MAILPGARVVRSSLADQDGDGNSSGGTACSVLVETGKTRSEAGCAAIAPVDGYRNRRRNIHRLGGTSVRRRGRPRLRLNAPGPVSDRWPCDLVLFRKTHLASEPDVHLSTLEYR